MQGLDQGKNVYGLYVQNGKWNLKKQDGTIDVYTSVEGKISNVQVKKITPKDDQEFKEYEALRIFLENGNNLYVLSLNAAYSTASNFFNVLPLIKPEFPIKVIAYKGDTNFDAIMVEQNGVRFSSYYTKSNNHGKPEWVKQANGGYDKTAELEFFKESVKEWLQKLWRSKETTPQKQPSTSFDPNHGFDDLPDFLR
jgi:hypothetical protein